MQIAVTQEQRRGAAVSDISTGRSELLSVTLKELGCVDLPAPPSADLLSRVDDELRVIEVKGRGMKGPIDLLERQLDTFRAAASASWLYVVWNCTQPSGQELWLVQDPSRLPWDQTHPASRPKSEPRGTRHEAGYRVDWHVIEQFGEQAQLPVDRQ